MSNQDSTKTAQTFYDLLITKLNNQINDLTTKYKESLLTIQELQTKLLKYEPKQDDKE